MEQTNIGERRQELEGLLKGTKKERNVGFAKAVGGVVLPLAASALVGIGTTYMFENKDLAKLISLGLGVAVGASGAVGDYLEAMRDVFNDIRYSYQRVRSYGTELQSLKQQQ